MADPRGPAADADGVGDPTGPPARSRPRRQDTTPAERRRQRRAQDREDRRRGRSGSERGPAHRGEPADARARSPRRPGRREALGTQRRRRARLRTGLGVGLLLVVAAAVVVVASLGLDRARSLVGPDDGAEPATVAPGDRQPALALVTHDEASGEAATAAILVLAYDRDEDQGTVLLIPGGTVADLPGHGSYPVRDAYSFGQAPLLAVTLDNLLDVRLDGVASIGLEGWREVGDALGPVPVDVRSRLVAPAGDAGGEVRFEPGAQELDGDRLVEYLTFRGEGETELEALPRLQQVVAGILDRVHEDRAALRDLLGDDGATEGILDGATEGDEPGVLATPDPALASALLTELADARQRDRLTTLTLPVVALGTGREDLYRLDASRAEQVIDERLAASRPTEATGAGRTLQVLNGNGVPGIGQQVAERLQPGGYRILLTGNADRFTHETTRIVVYDDSAEQLAIARDIRERLGAGEIERSATPQSVVDVTIVVGADFPPDRGSAGEGRRGR
jgi:polyisoprenyl-teichoic acid--peptidoglycan teichoic acid transferase